MTKLLATLVASLFVAGAAYADDMKKDAAAPAKTEAKKEEKKVEAKKDEKKAEMKKEEKKAEAKKEEPKK